MALHLSSFPMPHLQVQVHNLHRPRYHPQRAQDGASMSRKVTCCVTATTQTSRGRSANYQPTIWDYNFVQSLRTEDVDEECENKAKKLEEEVRRMMNNENAELLSILELIDDIQRLGLGYRFHEDIKIALDRISMSWEEYDDDAKAENKLHSTALRFRLLRQNGCHISQDIFKIFIDQEGNYMEYLKKDVKGLLSLYEASYLAFEGEKLLDEAKTFSLTHLTQLNRKIDPIISDLVTHALENPLHQRLQRLEARWYIEVYSKRNDANHSLLELARLDFNRVQLIYKKDLKDLSRWWKEIDLASKVKFARDRLMECFFWTIGMIPDPQFNNCRKGLTKVVSLITILDDVYDLHGSLDELKLFTNAVERWDINCVNQLPNYMKLCFLALYNSVNEMGYDTLKEQGVNIIPSLTKAWLDLCKAFLEEAKWSYNKYTPTFEEYLHYAWLSSSGTLLLVHSYFLFNQGITDEALDSLEKYHNLCRRPSVIFRLYNDLSTFKAEEERGETASSILCYMQERGLSEEIAREDIKKLIEKNWRQMNKEVSEKHPFSQAFVETVIHLARTAHCTYQNGDGHGHPDARIKKRILSVIIDPI
ncbi:isoprene synthase, chloroplastic-like [Mangifera indica]|uniref:isoprene synthase, chloroplastic-like n=1 Tax=Mangifera indica TaxID=29780 RepID=UPI001CFC0B8E|nr:isoprene synthase, chloroplastic-like [Mangifera indica]